MLPCLGPTTQYMSHANRQVWLEVVLHDYTRLQELKLPSVLVTSYHRAEKIRLASSESIQGAMDMLGLNLDQVRTIGQWVLLRFSRSSARVHPEFC